MIFASLMSSHIRAIPMLSFFTWLSPVFSSSLQLQGQFVEVEKWVLQTADAFRPNSPAVVFRRKLARRLLMQQSHNSTRTAPRPTRDSRYLFASEKLRVAILFRLPITTQFLLTASSGFLMHHVSGMQVCSLLRSRT